jgi:hypothetical protein
VLGTVILQALTLHAAFSLLLDPAANLPLLGVPVADRQAVLTTLMIFTVLLWTTVKIPGLMRQYVTGGRSTNVVAAVMRITMVQRLGRILTGGASWPHRLPPGRGRPGAGRSGPRPTPPTGGGPQPGQPPRFSHAPKRHRPIPRPANATAAPAVSHRQPAATPLPAWAATPRPAGFSHQRPAVAQPSPCISNTGRSRR